MYQLKGMEEEKLKIKESTATRETFQNYGSSEQRNMERIKTLLGYEFLSNIFDNWKKMFSKAQAEILALQKRGQLF